MKADHGGFYRFELASAESAEPLNANYVNSPITPWYSLHEESETTPITFPGRVVGWTKNETDYYLSVQNVVGAGNPGRMNAAEQLSDSQFCQENYSECFLDEKVEIPATTPPGKYVLRFNWVCAETRQDYNNCLDITVLAGVCQFPSLPDCVNSCPVDADYADCVSRCMS